MKATFTLIWASVLITLGAVWALGDILTPYIPQLAEYLIPSSTQSMFIGGIAMFIGVNAILSFMGWWRQLSNYLSIIGGTLMMFATLGVFIGWALNLEVIPYVNNTLNMTLIGTVFLLSAILTRDGAAQVKQERAAKALKTIAKREAKAAKVAEKAAKKQAKEDAKAQKKADKAAPKAVAEEASA